MMVDLKKINKKHCKRANLTNQKISVQQNSKANTLLVVMEDGSEATATDHSTFKMSKTRVSPRPGKL